jgi:hypothetical protein
MRAPRSLQVVAGLGLAAALGGCDPLGYPTCYRVACPYPPVYQNSYAGYVPANVDGRPAFGEPPFDDPFADYTHRSLLISQGSGNAQAAAVVMQTATPWPPNSTNTSIPGNGAQMVKAVNEFESGKRPSLDTSSSSSSSPGIQINNNSGATSSGAQ